MARTYNNNYPHLAARHIDTETGQLTYKKRDGSIHIHQFSVAQAEQISRWMDRAAPGDALIQDVCTLLSDDERELLQSGMSPKECDDATIHPDDRDPPAATTTANKDGDNEEPLPVF